MFPFWYLDYPDICQDNPAPQEFKVKGWIAATEDIDAIRFREDFIACKLPVSRHPRPDVKECYGLPAVGFEAKCSFDMVCDYRFLELVFTSGGREFEIIVPVHSGNVDVAGRKKDKLSRIKSLLACPECRSADLTDRGELLHCGQCGEDYPHNSSCYNFLTAAIRKNFNIESTDNVSANDYDGVSLNLLHKYCDGLVLDCGAGLRKKYYSNVVNYEIVAYDSTDVLGVGERLPFKDNVFDAVFSFAVLEHVKDPSVCAGELVRVLKPEGVIYCNVPFLQPLHGYPHHYFNMTQKAMLTLFKDLIEPERVEVLNFGQPVFTLSWFLNSYIAGLPKDIAGKFRKMKIADLLNPAQSYLGEPFVHALSDKVQEELACCNMLIGRKKS